MNLQIRNSDNFRFTIKKLLTSNTSIEHIETEKRHDLNPKLSDKYPEALGL